MLHLIIVDDEPLAVKGVKTAVNWEKLGVSAIFTAYSAAQAKEIFATNRIDLMLCDIEMPQDSGLDLLSWVKEHYPRTESIFLTCHADFAFAKQAIQLGSLDYLLKPIPPEELEAAMVKAVEKIRTESELVKDSQAWAQHHPLFIERFWLDIVNLAIPSNRDAVRKAMEERKIPYSEDAKVLPVLIHVQRWHKPISLRDEKILEYGLKNAAAETIRELGIEARLMTLDRNQLLAVLLIPNNAKVEESEVKNGLESYISSCHRYFYCDLACYVGTPVCIHDTAGMVNGLLALKNNNVAYNNRVFLFSGKPRLSVPAKMPDLKVWSVMLTQGLSEQVISEVKQYLAKMTGNSGLDAPFMHQLHQDFLQIVYSVLQQKGIHAHQLFNDSNSMELSAKATRSVADMIEWIEHMVSRAMERVRDIEQSTPVVEKVKQYISRHFAQELSRESIAKLFFMSPDYLDRILKKETGMSMKEYLLHERLRVAQELLVKTDMPVTDIATHVNITNLSHFAKVFRNHTGLTPSEFRNRRRG